MSHTASLIQAKQWYLSDSLQSTLIKAFLGSLIIALFAQISIPLQPVPITGQTLGVTIVGFALGAKAGTGAVLMYLLEGALGLPVFAGGASGYAALLGKTGGYLIGFIPSAWVLGYASDKGVLNHKWATLGVALLSAAITFAFGLLQLSFFVPADKLLQFGLIPFIPGGVIKALIASALIIPAYNFFKKI
ncbi:MAG: biotin transporter BioY [Cardiobacteriaceae bacterium]|nr:biotin transporter BioY [Cardiobacteriaceae bacterium]